MNKADYSLPPTMMRDTGYHWSPHAPNPLQRCSVFKESHCPVPTVVLQGAEGVKPPPTPAVRQCAEGVPLPSAPCSAAVC